MRPALHVRRIELVAHATAGTTSVHADVVPIIEGTTRLAPVLSFWGGTAEGCAGHWGRGGCTSVAYEALSAEQCNGATTCDRQRRGRGQVDGHRTPEAGPHDHDLTLVDVQRVHVLKGGHGVHLQSRLRVGRAAQCTPLCSPPRPSTTSGAYNGADPTPRLSRGGAHAAG